MSALPLLVVLAVTEPPRVLAISSGIRDGRPILAVLTAGTPGEVSVWRDGDEIVVTLGATAPSELRPPTLVPPLESVRIERAPAGVTLHVRLSTDMPYEVQRTAGSVTVLFGNAPEAAAPAPRPEATTTPRAPPVSAAGSGDLADLYRKILPAPEETGGGQVAGAGEQAPPKPTEETSPGLSLGMLRLRPSFTGTYVDAQTTLLATPQPVQDHYYQLQPRAEAEFPLGTGKLTGSYEVRIRHGSAFQQVRETTHLLDAGIELPVGPSVVFRAAEHHSKGVLETNEVDPGGEYFFDLGRFTRNQVSGGARVETGARIDLDVNGAINSVHVDAGTGFFAYQIRTIGAAAGYQVGASLRATLGYGYEQVPAPAERPLAASSAHTVSVSLGGEVLPLVRGDVTVGYRDGRSPAAGPGGTRYRGLAGSLQLSKDFSRASRLRLAASRSTPLSNFETNAFYVATSTEAEVTLPLPASLSARGGAGYHWNDYRTVAAGLGAPRKDRIFGWSAGLGRPVTRWGYVRVDYRKDRRNSNLDLFDARTHTLTVQLGLGFFGSESRR